ncbi:ABC transporter permease [Gracilimonas tropica]|uniref:ABC transporter permease n=1 Tax=Gracilimonas tropica TaxID=454600 RepID=UPI000476BC75|nr:ABC transporter permease [Gracilimonas tropica]
MRIIRVLLRKEFLQIFRNKSMLPILFVMPVIQLLVLSFAATYELKEVDMALIDADQSELSRALVSRFQASGYFVLELETFNPEEALEAMDEGQVSMIIQIPQGFETDFKEGRKAHLQLIIDAVDGSTAGLIQSYSTSILKDLNAEKLVEVNMRNAVSAPKLSSSINIIPQNWYNPNLDYITYMVPGILVVLVSMIGLFLSGMNIVREQEIGTIEQLNVTPIRKYQFMIGKLLPFWVIGMVDLLIGLALARYGFQIPFLGNLFTVLAVAGIFLITIQSLGLLISTVTHTQQQAMFIAWFLMVVFILLGGLFTPIESMPNWAQNLTLVNPIAYFIKIMRMVLLKGAGWIEIQNMVYVLLFMGSVLLLVSIKRYKKTAQ